MSQKIAAIAATAKGIESGCIKNALYNSPCDIIILALPIPQPGQGIPVMERNIQNPFMPPTDKNCGSKYKA